MRPQPSRPAERLHGRFHDPGGGRQRIGRTAAGRTPDLHLRPRHLLPRRQQNATLRRPHRPSGLPDTGGCAGRPRRGAGTCPAAGLRIVPRWVGGGRNCFSASHPHHLLHRSRITQNRNHRAHSAGNPPLFPPTAPISLTDRMHAIDRALLSNRNTHNYLYRIFIYT